MTKEEKIKEKLNVLIKNKIDFKIVMTKDDFNIEIITGDLIDELLALIEQEKKATIKLVLLGFQCALDEEKPERAVEETILRIAERYGVEL